MFHFDLYGKREMKYDFLFNNSLKTIDYKELPNISPNYFFISKDFDEQLIYEKGFSINELFTINSIGIVTARDGFTLHEQKEDVKKIIEDFLNIDDETARRKFNLGKDVRDWQVQYARSDLRKNFPHLGSFCKVTYRPFDDKWTFYTGKSKGFHCFPRNEVMQHLLKGENISLVTARQCVGDWRYIFLSKLIGEFNLTGTAGRFGSGYYFPLYLYKENNSHSTFRQNTFRTPNLNLEFINQISKDLRLAFTTEKEVN